MSVAIGGGVDDDLDALVGVERAVVEPVLRAEIGGWFGREFALGKSIEFGAVVV